MKKLIIISLITAGAVLFAQHPAQAYGSCSGKLKPVKVITRDAAGTLQGGISFIVYEQLTNPDGNPYFGTALGSGKTDAGGQGTVCVVDKNLYAVKAYESNATYGFFTAWNDQMTDIPDLYLHIAEFRMSSLNVVLRDAAGTVIKDAAFDVYVQSFDINNNPIIDETKLNKDELVVADLNTGAYGARNAFLAPGNFVVRVHATGGKTYFYIWNQVVAAQTVTSLDYRLSTLRIILEDGYGSLVKNQKFSIYAQEYDIRGKSILGSLVANTLTTGTTGYADAYIPAGSYALKINGTVTNDYYYKWASKVSDQEMTTVTYRMSGFRIIINDANGNLVRSAKISIGSQRYDALGKPILDKVILKDVSTGEAGYVDIYLSPAAYVLIYGDKRMYQLDANENQFTKIDWPRSVTLRPQSEIQLTNPYGNVNLTLRSRAAAKPKLSKYKVSLSKTYVVQATTIKKAYTVTFTYTDATLTKKKTKADKVKIAFYNTTTKKWSYVGKNTPSKHQAKATLKDKGYLVLVAVK